jgi:hypothetical protein
MIYVLDIGLKCIIYRYFIYEKAIARTVELLLERATPGLSPRPRVRWHIG